MHSVLCTCDSIRFRIQKSYLKRFSQNTKKMRTSGNPADVSVIWLRTLIQRVNIYLFQFNWIALINVSSAFIWWEQIKTKKTPIPHMRASTTQLFCSSNRNVERKQKWKNYLTITKQSKYKVKCREKKKNKQKAKKHCRSSIAKKCTTLQAIYEKKDRINNPLKYLFISLSSVSKLTASKV